MKMKETVTCETRRVRLGVDVIYKCSVPKRAICNFQREAGSFKG